MFEFGNILLTVICIFVAIALRYELNLNNTTKIMAEEFSKDSGTDFRIIQANITDPKRDKYAITTYIAVILLQIVQYYYYQLLFHTAKLQ